MKDQISYRSFQGRTSADLRIQDLEAIQQVGLYGVEAGTKKYLVPTSIFQKLKPGSS